ncbi:MAG: DUF3795 domain-containing protein [Candidatus Cloacimonetes bacterium]|nr:DUF3795 domain-containing protein [Candidatus Cloacimonadota bacterium]
MIAKCGVNCPTDCRAYGVDCAGCNELEGKVSWAEFYGRTRCPIYECVKNKGLPNCATCGQAPCQVWYDTRNPDASDEEFEADIRNRLSNLAREG